MTPAPSNLAESFVVSKYIGPAVLESIDRNQFELSPVPQLYMPSFAYVDASNG